MISIIIRTKNEERWIGRCLRMVFKQTYQDFEVIIVDNDSVDHTVSIASKHPVKIVNISDFKPGAAINHGIRASKGDYIVCLSAHCIPKNDLWLQSLLNNLNRYPEVAGVYGRQLPFLYSSDLDKRDLLITFGLDHRIQYRDHFFHNANSMIRRSVWDTLPFDEDATNIEDRIWGKAVIESGLQLAYEPEASVYHLHGIHQSRDEKRAERIVRIMESLEACEPAESIPEGFKTESMNILAILPVRGEVSKLAGVNLLQHCLKQISDERINLKVMVVSENQEALALAEASGALSLQRPPELLEKEVPLGEVLRYALRMAEESTTYYDAVLYVNYQYPFRPHHYFGKIIGEFCFTGVDSILPTLPDYQPCWVEANGGIVRKDAAFMPRHRQLPTQRGIAGLGLVSSSEFVRKGQLLGDQVALVPIDETLYSIRAGDAFSNMVLSVAFEKGPSAFGVGHVK